jgi:HAD superfamily hydrolase (TIGR01458 family)
MTDKIKTVLLDIYGTVYVEGQWLPGAKETVNWLIKNQINFKFITNTTLKNRQMLHQTFKNGGMDISPESFFIPICAANAWLNQQAINSDILALIHSSQKEELTGLSPIESGQAKYVLVGDMGDEWNIDIMNEALHALLGGAKLLALQKNPYWLASDGFKLDNGSFIAALEYGAGVRCEMFFGKPNGIFFQMALAESRTSPSEAIMVGDEIETDILGAYKCGIKGVLIKTGKFRPDDVKKLDSSDSTVINSIKDLPGWIEKNWR